MGIQVWRSSLLLTLVLIGLCYPVMSKVVMLPMRDGVKLHTAINQIDFPKKNLTSIYDRSPYGQFAIELIAEVFGIVLSEYASIEQDMRGCAQSEGDFVIWQKCADDMYDTMEWATKQTWSDGSVMLEGFSADGMNAMASIKGKPSWVQGIFVGWTTGQGYEIAFPGGSYRKSLVELWMRTIQKDWQTPCKVIMAAENPTDKFWDLLEGQIDDYKWVNFPIVSWGGWYDIFLMGQLVNYEGIRKYSPSAEKAQLVIDPLGHCQGAAEYFGNNTILGRVALPILLAIDMFGKTNFTENVSAITWYVMGPHQLLRPSIGNFWTTRDYWPSYTNKLYYMDVNGKLSSSKPTIPTAKSTWDYDPKDPVPTIGGNNLELKCGPLDQSPVEQGKRKDVMTFTSDKLTEAMALTGPLIAKLWVSSSCKDTDFTAKLTDVYPNGESHLIQDGMIRMRWRFGTSKPDPQLMEPGVIYEVDVLMWNTSYIFNAGHRLRVSISSSNYPRYSANPNNGLSLLTPGPNITAHNTLYHDASHPSYISLPVVSLSDLPEVPVHLVVENAVKKLFQEKAPGVKPPSLEELFETLEQKIAHFIQDRWDVTPLI